MPDRHCAIVMPVVPVYPAVPTTGHWAGETVVEAPKTPVGVVVMMLLSE